MDALDSSGVQQSVVQASLIIFSGYVGSLMPEVVGANPWYQAGAVLGLLTFLIPSVYLLHLSERIADPPT